MGKDPAMPMYVNDWLSSPTVQAMSQEQELGFFRLLLFAWASQEAAIPDDDATLMRLGRFKRKDSLTVVKRSFSKHPSKPQHLTNKRLFELWIERQEWREKCRLAGLASGEQRRNQPKPKKLVKNKRPLNGSSTKRELNGNSSSSFTSPSSVSSTINVLGGMQGGNSGKSAADIRKIAAVVKPQTIEDRVLIARVAMLIQGDAIPENSVWDALDGVRLAGKGNLVAYWQTCLSEKLSKVGKQLKPLMAGVRASPELLAVFNETPDNRLCVDAEL